MIPVLTVAQMRKIDETAIGGNTARGFFYMARAGAGLLDAARKMAPDPKAGDIAVVCGKGNNGGDGYLAATLLMDAGYNTMCYGLFPPEELTKEARIAFDGYVARKGNFMVLDDVSDLDNLGRCSLVIDAILGTGIKGNPHGMAAKVIAAINASGLPVLAADTPSGLDNDTGLPGEPCIKAAATVAMGFPKIGSFFYPGRGCVGELVVRELGYPDDIVNKVRSNIFYPTLAALRKMLPPRKPAGSKVDHGVCLMVCGSRGMAGSAQLAATAALRTGCGMVHLISPRSTIDTLSSKLTEIVLHAAPETDEGTLAPSALQQITELARTARAVCIGPGLSHQQQTSSLVRQVVAKLAIPLVLDADGINAFKGRTDELKKHRPDLVITPHAGEWNRIFPELPPDPVESFAALQKKADEYRITVLYKGNPSRVVEPKGAAAILPYGNSGMATAGSGDVLSGIITSLIAQGAPVHEAAILGAYLHGKAGDFASEEFGEYSMIAGDMIGQIHKAVKMVS